ncbi:MAG TPA: sugar phosphate isomerase/epimerase [Bryobacteraceae bacterium]|nr:sugar phosphate isomerase/epimerase [Bryobacteraceae bacterium]
MKAAPINLGIVADEIDRDFERAVRVGVSLGLRRYEVRFLKSGRAPLCDRAELLAAEHLAREEGLEITALSPGLFKQVSDEEGFRREMRELYPLAVEWARRWNLPGLIAFGFRKPGATEQNGHVLSSDNPPQQVIDWLTEAGEQARADGLELLIEPELVCWADSGRATAALLRRARSSALKVNYDAGNIAWLEQRDPIDEFDELAPLIANVHVKDLRPKPDGARPEFLPVGEGIIDYRAHFHAMQCIGYKGPISLEPHMDGSEATIRRCRDAFERLWSA